MLCVWKGGVAMDDDYNLFSLVKPKINDVPDATMPDNVKLKNNQMWCPYCSSPVVFIKLRIHVIILSIPCQTRPALKAGLVLTHIYFY